MSLKVPLLQGSLVFAQIYESIDAIEIPIRAHCFCAHVELPHTLQPTGRHSVVKFNRNILLLYRPHIIYFYRSRHEQKLMRPSVERFLDLTEFGAAGFALSLCVCCWIVFSRFWLDSYIKSSGEKCSSRAEQIQRVTSTHIPYIYTIYYIPVGSKIRTGSKSPDNILNNN